METKMVKVLFSQHHTIYFIIIKRKTIFWQKLVEIVCDVSSLFSVVLLNFSQNPFDFYRSVCLVCECYILTSFPSYLFIHTYNMVNEQYNDELVRCLLLFISSLFLARGTLG